MATTHDIVVPDSATRSAQAADELQDMHGEKMVLNVGPSHPATHGVLRLAFELGGEICLCRVWLRYCLVLGACTLPSLVSSAEDLTTLDGKTYTNITEFAKYPNQIFFKYNENRIGVAISNLSPEFREKHGLTVQTNASKERSLVQKEADPTDLFLWQNRQGDLYQIECDYFRTNSSGGIGTHKQFCLQLKHTEISLSVDTTTTYNSPKLRDSENSQLMHFDLGQESTITDLFNKFLEWDAIAVTNRAENFEKEIGRRPLNRSASEFDKERYKGVCVYDFAWESGKARLDVKDVPPHGGYFEKEDVIHFQKLIKLLPTMKEKMVAAIRAKEAQKELFK